MRITINAGHAPSGIPDPGAVNIEIGLKEAIVNHDVAMNVVNLLDYDGHETQFVQDDNLAKICELANEFDADIFISIHCNAAENAEAHGTETYHVYGSPGSSMLAQYVHSEIVSIGLTNRGTKTAKFYVLEYTKMPAILVELAFISNEKDAKLLASEDGKNQLAEAIYRGITHYKKAVIV